MVKHLPKVRLVKAMVFPVVMYGYESWTVKKAEHQRIDAFELWSKATKSMFWSTSQIKSSSSKCLVL